MSIPTNVASRSQSRRYNPSNQTEYENSDQSFLWFGYKRERSVGRSALDGAEEFRHFEHGTPFVFHSETTSWPKEGEESKRLKIGHVFDTGLALFASHRKADGASGWSLLNPLYTVRRGADGERPLRDPGPRTARL